MVAGYSGFIPKVRTEIGRNGRQTTIHGLAELERERLHHETKRYAMTAVMEDHRIAARTNARPIQQPDPRVYVDTAPEQFSSRTYSRRAGIMAGYMGHIPQKSSLIVGKSFGVASREIAAGVQSGMAPSWTPRSLEDKANLSAEPRTLSGARWTGILPAAATLALSAYPVNQPVYTTKHHRHWVV